VLLLIMHEYLCEMQGMVGNSRSLTPSIFMNVINGVNGVKSGGDSGYFDGLKDVY